MRSRSPAARGFAVFGYHVTGPTGTSFLFGIVVGAVAMLGLSLLLAGARRTAGRAATPDTILTGPNAKRRFRTRSATNGLNTSPSAHPAAHR